MPGEMPEKTRKMLLIFREAVVMEREAQMIYKHAAEVCQDEGLKDLLKGFYSDEVRHEKTLIQRYNRLRKRYGVKDEQNGSKLLLRRAGRGGRNAQDWR